MSPVLKAVASFTETMWQPVRPSSFNDDFYDAWHVLEEWNEMDTVGGVGLGFEDFEGIEWQKVDGDTLAYRIGGKVLLVITWGYDYCVDSGASWGVCEWTMGTGDDA